MSTPEPGVVRLRTGAEVPRSLVGPTRLALEALMDTNPIALYEAVEMARDPSHVPFGKTGDALRGYCLLDEGGQMHGASRDIILAATEAEAFDIRLVSPYASSTDTEESAT
jgi:hypothetical protein